jgi:hypothetical protein
MGILLYYFPQKGDREKHRGSITGKPQWYVVSAAAVRTSISSLRASVPTALQAVAQLGTQQYTSRAAMLVKRKKVKDGEKRNRALKLNPWSPINAPHVMLASYTRMAFGSMFCNVI